MNTSQNQIESLLWNGLKFIKTASIIKIFSRKLEFQRNQLKLYVCLYVRIIEKKSNRGLFNITEIMDAP